MQATIPRLGWAANSEVVAMLQMVIFWPYKAFLSIYSQARASLEC